MPTDFAGTGFSPQLRRLYEINKIHDRFESELKSRNQPEIESYLAKWSGDGLAEIFIELFALELHYRGKRGERPKLEEYCLRFPQYTKEISQEFPAGIGDYELIQLVGVGAFASVYQGRKKGTNVQRAVKVFLRRESSPDTLQRVRSEFEILSKIKHHRAIVTGHDVGCTSEGVVYLVMEYVDGESLEEKLKSKSKLLVSEAVKIILEVADGLAHAHQTMLHRDLKPSNILLGRDGQTYIVDFGLALPHDERYERRGELAGTYAYMSPEQVTEQTVNGRTDIWTTGVILYETLTGAHPFRGKNQHELFDQIKNLAPIPPRQRRYDIPEELERICLRCLEKEEGKRFGTASDLAAALRKLQEKPSTPTKLAAALRAGASAARRWVRPWMAMAAAIVIVGVFLYAIRHKSDEDIAKEIKRRLTSSAALSRIEVHVNGHVATLEGAVCNASEKDTAANIATGVSGKQCLDKIKVTGKTKVNSKDGLTYVWISPGTFKMGCSQPDPDRSVTDPKCEHNEGGHPHSVVITKGFWMGQTAVTQAAYRRVMGQNPRKVPKDCQMEVGDQLPIVCVMWDEAESYCSAVGMQLPTEAEWEYAARAESTASRYGDIDAIAWYKANSEGHMHPVGQKAPNKWWLYDMLGNVYQWTADEYDADYYSHSPLQDPYNPVSNPIHKTLIVLRGGAWASKDPSVDVRVSERGYNYWDVTSRIDGFRCRGD